MSKIKIDITDILFWLIVIIVIATLTWSVLGSSPTFNTLSIMLALLGIGLTLKGSSLISSISKNVYDLDNSINNNGEKLNRIDDSLNKIILILEKGKK